MIKHATTRVAVALAAAVTFSLTPSVPADATPVRTAPALVGHHAGGHAHRCQGYVEPWTGPVKRCKGRFTRATHTDLIAGGIWAPEFEPMLTPFGRAGSFFVYVGDTPVGWVDMPATGELGGTITLGTVHGDYVKGTQRIALYNSRGRLVAWDWITLQWDW